MWQTISKLCGFNRADEQERRQAELVRVYRDVFMTPEGQCIVADLSRFTNFFSANGPELTDRERAYRDGMKNVFARITGLLTLTDEERLQLQSAARDELLRDPVQASEEPTT